MPRKYKKKNADPLTGLTPNQLDAYKARMMGFTYQDIANSLGYSHPDGARKAVQAAIKIMEIDAKNDLRNLSFHTYETLKNKYAARAFSGEIKAAYLIMALVKEEVNMMGAKEPVKIDVSTNTKGTIILWDRWKPKSSKSPKPTNELKETTESNPPQFPGENL
jgi:hypothetical protein